MHCNITEIEDDVSSLLGTDLFAEECLQLLYPLLYLAVHPVTF